MHIYDGESEFDSDPSDNPFLVFRTSNESSSMATKIPPNAPKLGRKAAAHDVRTLEFGDYLLTGSAAPKAPATFSWADKVTTWPIMGNDRLGDCVIAGAGHTEQVWTTNNGNPLIIPDDQIIKAYADVSGYDPATGMNDWGCVLLDAMKYWRRVGIGGRKITAFVSVQPAAFKRIMQAIYLFEVALVGLNLPVWSYLQWQAGQIWQPGPGADGLPGSWGGHLIPLMAYAPGFVAGPTWGRMQQMTWTFIAKYCDEIYIPLGPDLIGPNGRSPGGFNWKQLNKDLQSL
jgi:hypothetical protein